MRLGPEVGDIPHIYDEIDQAKVVKNDNAAYDSTLWNEVVFEKPPTLEEVDGIIFKIVGHNNKSLEAEKAEIVIMESLRKAEKRRYNKNVNSSFKQYMITKYDSSVYGSEWIDDMKKSMKTLQEQRDFNEGLKAIKCASLATFWGWDGGSFPNFWRWQPEIH